MSSSTIGADRAPASAATTAYVMLGLAAWMWAGNSVASKWAVGEVSPQVLTTLRWGVAFVALLGVARGSLAGAMPLLTARWLYVLLMGGFGYTAFASLIYLAGTYTTATNLALFQGAIPVLVMLMNRALHGTRVSAGQAVGVAVTLAGVAVAASHGDLGSLLTLTFNAGDLMMLVACICYAGYTVGLPDRPAVPPLAFFAGMATAAFATSLPLLAAEWASGHLIWPTPLGWAIVAFVALMPTLAAQLLYMRGVAAIGPNRAGLFVNLVPIFGAFLAVLLVGEPFGPTQAIALALVIAGIACAERFRPRA